MPSNANPKAFAAVLSRFGFFLKPLRDMKKGYLKSLTKISFLVRVF